MSLRLNPDAGQVNKSSWTEVRTGGPSPTGQLGPRVLVGARTQTTAPLQPQQQAMPPGGFPALPMLPTAPVISPPQQQPQLGLAPLPQTMTTTATTTMAQSSPSTADDDPFGDGLFTQGGYFLDEPRSGGLGEKDAISDSDLARLLGGDDDPLFASEQYFVEDDGPAQEKREPGKAQEKSSSSSNSNSSNSSSSRVRDQPAPLGLRRQAAFRQPTSSQPQPSSSQPQPSGQGANGVSSSTTTTTTTVIVPPRAKADLEKLAASDMAKEAMQPQPRTSSQLIHGQELLTGLGVGKSEGLVSKTFKTPLDSYLHNLGQPLGDSPKKLGEQLARLDQRLQKAEKRIDQALAASTTPPTAREEKDAKVSAKLEGRPDKWQEYLPSNPKEKALATLKQQIADDRALLQNVAKRPPPPDSGLSLGQFIEMERLGMPNEAHRDMAVFNQATELSREPLGSGVVNVTDKVTYKGVPAAQVYKGAEPKVPSSVEVVGAIGIDYDKPLLANRNMASVAVDKELGLHLLPVTRFASRGNEVGVVMSLAPGKQPGKDHLLPTTKEEAAQIKQWQDDLEQGLRGADEFKQRMESKGFAIGKDGDWCRKSTLAATINTSDPKLMQLLSNLEWLDKLTGQVDRHMNNYLIEVDKHGNVVGLVGIDNDFAFGKNNADPAPLTKGTGEPAKMGHQIKGLPLLVDSATAQSVEDMAKDWNKQPDGMKAQLSKLLPPAEVAAAEKRLFATKAKDGFTGLLEHVQDLKAAGHVVPKDQWDTWRDPGGNSAHDLLAANMDSPQGKKWPGVENSKSYLAILETEATAARTLEDGRI